MKASGSEETLRTQLESQGSSLPSSLSPQCSSQDANGVDQPAASLAYSRKLAGTQCGQKLSASPQSSRHDSEEWTEHKGRDAFPGKNAHVMLATDIDDCKQLCVERGFGAFAVWRGTAYFRSESAKACYANLKESYGSTLYIKGLKESGHPNMTPPSRLSRGPDLESPTTPPLSPGDAHADDSYGTWIRRTIRDMVTVVRDVLDSPDQTHKRRSKSLGGEPDSREAIAPPSDLRRQNSRPKLSARSPLDSWK